MRGRHRRAVPGDVVLGDRGFCSYAHLAMLLSRELHGVFRVHQRQIVDFTPGRPQAPRRGEGQGASRGDDPAALAVGAVAGRCGSGGRLVQAQAEAAWMTAEEYAALPEELTVRELRYRVETPGYRVGEVTLVTTLLDAAAYPAAALADLYFRRWQVEVYLRHLKITMKMDVLRCETVEGVLKELAVFALAYNLVRSVACESAQVQGVAAERVSVMDAVRWLVGAEGDEDLSVMVVNPSRGGSCRAAGDEASAEAVSVDDEAPRAVLRKELTDKKVAA